MKWAARMFEGWKKLIGDSVSGLSAALNPAAPDLMAMPPAAAPGTLLSAIPVETLSAYLGVDVAEVRPVDPPQLGAALGSLLKGPGGGDIGNAFAGLLTGDHPRRDEILRKHGLSDADISAVRDHATDEADRYRASGWTFAFVRGKSVSVRLFPRGDTDAGFDSMKSAEALQRTRVGAADLHNDVFRDHVREFRGGPYESYSGPGYLTSRGRTHDARAEGFPGVATEIEIRAGIAALALRCAEGA